jgi:hypothetical protein
VTKGIYELERIDSFHRLNRPSRSNQHLRARRIPSFPDHGPPSGPCMMPRHSLCYPSSPHLQTTSPMVLNIPTTTGISLTWKRACKNGATIPLQVLRTATCKDESHHINMEIYKHGKSLRPQ